MLIKHKFCTNIFIVFCFLFMQVYLTAAPAEVWTDVSPAVSPSGRSSASIAFNPTSGQTILFGGLDENNVYQNDTWALNYDSSNDTYTWVQLNIAGTLPPGRTDAAMEFDANSGQIILFGGFNGGIQNLGDTWALSYNSSNDTYTWTQLNFVVSPAARRGTSMTYDPSSGQMILFAGFSDSGRVNDTWTLSYDHTTQNYTWTQLNFSTIPAVRSQATMAFDPSSGNIILFGGAGSINPLNDTWSLIYDSSNQTYNWTQISFLNPIPSPRFSASMAFDASTGQMILFGGSTIGFDFNDTWALNYDFSNQTYTWTQLNVSGPTAREEAAMVFDPSSGKIISFGGVVGFNKAGDTWTFGIPTNASLFWRDISPPASPAVRYEASMAFNPSSGQIILFGGFNNQYLSDTWALTYDSSNQSYIWTNLNISGPSARYGAAMDFDETTGKMILYGGTNGSFFNDTWELAYNSLTQTYSWSQINASGPSARFNTSLAFDPRTGQMILFGGNDGNELNDTWMLNYNSSTNIYNWVQINTATAPPVREGGSMAFNLSSGQMILFGGLDNANVPLGDTWELTYNSLTDTYNWSQINISGPSVRYGAQMEFNQSDGRIILFGGTNSINALNDTWQLIYTNGNYVWNQLNIFGPVGRLYSSMAFDLSSGQMILFGGFGSIGGYHNDTWTLLLGIPPQITSPNTVTFVVGQASSFNVTTTGDPVPSITEAGTLPAGITFVDNGNGTATLSGTPQAGTGGSYPLQFTATNEVGIVTQNFTLIIDEAPVFTSPDTTTFVVGQSSNFTVTTTGFPIATITETGTLPAGITFVDNGNGTATLSGTPQAGTGGTYALQFTASNGLTTVQNFTLIIDEAPVFTSPDTATFVVGQSSNFTVTTTGFPIATITEIGILPAGINFVDNGNGTATLSGTPQAGTEGTYLLQLTASNGLTTVQNFTLIINKAPVFTSADMTVFVIGQPSSFNVTTTGFPVASLTETGALPAGITFVDNGNGTATLSGTPQAGTEGTYHLIFTASNSVSSVTQDFTLVISLTPVTTTTTLQVIPNPAIVGQPVTLIANVGQNIPGTVTFFDGDTPIGTVFLNQGIATLTLSFTPGIHNLYAVYNGSFPYQPSTSATITLEVETVLPPKRVKGFQVANTFATQREFVNIITWQAPCNGTSIVAYRIYRDPNLTKLIAHIPSDEKLEFKDHDRKKGKTYSYYIVSIDQFGNKSIPAKITIKSKS